MAVVIAKSSTITNRDAATRKLTDSAIINAFVREAVGVVSMASGDSIGSQYKFTTVPSHVRVSDILLTSDDVGTTTVADIGVYKSTAAGGAVVDADFFASAVVLNAGPLSAVAEQNESGFFTTANMEKPLWQALGLTEDPRIDYDIVATLTAAADATANVGLRVRFVI